MALTHLLSTYHELVQLQLLEITKAVGDVTHGPHTVCVESKGCQALHAMPPHSAMADLASPQLELHNTDLTGPSILAGPTGLMVSWG